MSVCVSVCMCGCGCVVCECVGYLTGYVMCVCECVYVCVCMCVSVCVCVCECVCQASMTRISWDFGTLLLIMFFSILIMNLGTMYRRWARCNGGGGACSHGKIVKIMSNFLFSREKFSRKTHLDFIDQILIIEWDI